MSIGNVGKADLRVNFGLVSKTHPGILILKDVMKGFENEHRGCK